MDIYQILGKKFKDNIPNKIDLDYSLLLHHSLSLEDIEHALFSMKSNKSLGFDGLPIGFYQIMWNHIKDDFYMLYLEALHNGSLGPSTNKCLIKFIPKGKN